MSPRFRAATLAGFHAVLDLDHDRYLAVPANEPQVRPDDRREQLAKALRTQGDEVDFACNLHPSVKMPTRDLGPRSNGAYQEPTLLDWTALAIAIPIALAQLKWRSPRTWFKSDGRTPLAVSQDLVETARRFRSMRPYLPNLGRCLPHALLLLAYLRMRGFAAHLVLGVRLFPFDAHSWIQAGDVVLTDDLEQLSSYTPIAIG